MSEYAQLHVSTNDSKKIDAIFEHRSGLLAWTLFTFLLVNRDGMRSGLSVVFPEFYAHKFRVSVRKVRAALKLLAEVVAPGCPEPGLIRWDCKSNTVWIVGKIEHNYAQLSARHKRMRGLACELQDRKLYPFFTDLLERYPVVAEALELLEISSHKPAEESTDKSRRSNPIGSSIPNEASETKRGSSLRSTTHAQQQFTSLLEKQTAGIQDAYHQIHKASERRDSDWRNRLRDLKALITVFNQTRIRPDELAAPYSAASNSPPIEGLEFWDRKNLGLPSGLARISERNGRRKAENLVADWRRTEAFKDWRDAELKGLKDDYEALPEEDAQRERIRKEFEELKELGHE